MNLFASVPLLAVGYGNLDAATNTTWCVPGMGTDAADGTGAWSRAARNLYAVQKDMSGVVPGVIAWLGYDTPDPATVTGSAAATVGASRFAAEIDGNTAARAAGSAGPTLLAVVAHSYGTTLASYALTRTDSRVSSFVMVGSAGIDTALVPSLAGVHADRVFTTSATADQLAPFGAELAGRAVPNPEVAHPTSPAIGGSTRFSSDGDGGALLRVDGHNPLGEARPGPLGRVFNTVPSAGHGYFDLNTQSLANIAAVSTGRLDEVSGALSSTTADAAKHNEDAEMIQDAQPKSPRL